MPTVHQVWADAAQADYGRRAMPRDDVVLERAAGEGVFVQEHGPFGDYRRTLRLGAGGTVEERIDYRLTIPWFGWLFAWPVRRSLRQRPPVSSPPGAQPWWAPPDRLEAVQVLVLGLLAAASMTASFVNTLFTQTVNFAASEFGVDNRVQGNAGTVVRFGILLVAPLAVVADRLGRRRVIVAAAWAAPILAALGAFAPGFVVLTASQTVARPVGLALDLLIAVMAAEVMPRNSRAYAVSLTAMSGGLGAGICVVALRLADLGTSAWRLVYVLAVIWLLVAADLARRLPETERFQAHRAAAARRGGGVDRGRLFAQAAVAFAGNLFIAPASFFQNRYLDDVRGFSGGRIALFTIATSTPLGIGVLLGGRIADRAGRRILGAGSAVAGTALVVVSFGVRGWPMWASALVGGIVFGAAVPALGVYRAEMFPTGSRSSAGYVILAVALVGGSIGLQIVGRALDDGVSHVRILGLLGLGQIVVAAIVLRWFPETAHRELEELNPTDAA